MYRMLFLVAMSLIVMGAIPFLTLAETPSSETVIVVPMNSLPSYGSLVSAWYKQRRMTPRRSELARSRTCCSRQMVRSTP